MDHNQLKARLLAKPDVFQQNAFKSLRPNLEKNKKERKVKPLNPLPHLAEYQRKQKERSVPITLSQNEPIFKKAKRSDSVEPLEDCLTSKLPELPDDLKKKQHDIEISAGYRQPTPPKKEDQRPKSNHQRHGRYTVGAHQIDSDFLDKIIESELSDPLAILKLIRNHSNIGFLYMTTAVDKSSINYNPYNVKVVSHSNIDKSDHFTISKLGVTHINNGEAEFTPLNQWEKELHHYSQLIKIKTFANFRMWKAFYVWKKNVRGKKISLARSQLQSHLFIINKSLRPALLSVRDMCYRISDMGLCRLEKGVTYTLQDFRDIQFQQLQRVASRLAEFRELVKEVVRSACRTTLLEAGFVPDENNEQYGPTYSGNNSPYSEEYEMYEEPDKMTYTEQANKRSRCRRLTR